VKVYYKVSEVMRNSFLYSAVLLVLYFVSCQKCPKNSKLIDYTNIEEFEVRLFIEVGQNENYIPGILSELVIMSDGTMLVSDIDKITIEQFNPDGEHIATIAREGRGPGELRPNFNLFKGKNDVLIVRQRGMYQQMDFFSRKNEQVAYKYSGSNRLERSKDRYVTLIGALTDSTYLARTGNVISSQQLLINLKHFNHIKSPLVVTDQSENIIQDSLQILKIPLSVFLPGEGVINFATPPYQFYDRAKITDDGNYLIAHPGSEISSLTLFESDHSPIKEIKLPIKPRQVKQTELNYRLRDVKSNPMRKALLSRVDDLKPSFLDIWISEKVLALQTDINKDMQEVVFFSFTGKPKGKIHLPETVDIQHVKNDKLYTLYRDPNTGHAIRIYSIPILLSN